MSLVFSHPTGNANARMAVAAIFQAGLLAQFYTSIAVFPGGVLDQLSTFGPLGELQRRRFDPVLKPLTRTSPWREAGRLAATRSGLTSLTKRETGLFSIDAVYRGLDRKVARTLTAAVRRGVTGAYAYEDGAWAAFTKAKELGLKRFYDLPTGHWRAAHRLLEAERALWPEWEMTLGYFQDSETKLARKDDELRLADLIITASTFTASTLKEFPEQLAPVKVIPYGFPAVAEGAKPAVVITASRPLKLLFVGALSQAKGLANVFSAVESLGNKVELTVVGMKGGRECPALDRALGRHRWVPSLPHPEILKLMRAHDVLLFPSLFEGFGLVITEAMSQGTPVIATERTAGLDLIEDGHNGWLIKAGATEELKSAIESILSNPSQIAEVGRAAQATAAQRPWSVYARELVAAIQSAS